MISDVGGLVLRQPRREALLRAATPVSDSVRSAIDFAVALIALIFLGPLMLSVALAVALEGPGGILFSQERIGLNGRIFRCYKFRTMRPDARQALARLLADCPAAREEWAKDQKLKHDPRVTPLGVFLRKSSIDELPQLLNVLQGAMSLVGPRPIVSGEVCRYGRQFRYYCAVRPGITGLWQISGRSDVNYTRRVALDRCYVQRKSLIFDAWIMLATIPVVLTRRGAV